MQPKIRLHFLLFLFFSVAYLFVYFVRAVDRGKVNHSHGYAKEHIPELIRNDIVEKLEQWVPIVENGEHIVHLNDLACPVKHVVGNTVLVEKYVDEVDSNICAHRDGNCRPDALFIELYETKLEKYKRYAEFENVREIVENEHPACNFRRRNGRIEHDRRERTDRPKHKQVANALIARKHRYGQNHRIKRAEVERQIFYGRIPSKQVIYNSRYARKGKHTENDNLSFLRSVLKQKVNPDGNTRAKQK
jgi:hypothetical protein